MNRSRRTNGSLLRSLTALLFTALLVGFPALAFAAGSVAPASQSQPATSDVICHTSDPDECYPRIFQPTDEFQTVHEDQQLPPGLHVRLNIWTGQREAKINDPTEAGDPSLEGLPVDQGIIVVDPEEPPHDDPAVPVIPKGAPAYDNVGAVKEPQHEAVNFHQSLIVLKSGVASDEAAYTSALEDLEDLSHDIYYGLKVTEDSGAVKALLCLLADQGAGLPDSASSRTTAQAASILAGALSNNPTALKAVADRWPEFMSATCPHREGETLGDVLYSNIVSSTSSSTDAGRVIKAKVGALNGLIKDDAIRADFLRKGGMGQLIGVLAGPEDASDAKAWAGAQRKVGQLALDNFLDEEMGATLGQWPTAARLSESECQSGATSQQQQEEGCWDHHVERIMKENKHDRDHWSRDLHDRLGKARRAQRESAAHGEL